MGHIMLDKKIISTSLGSIRKAKFTSTVSSTYTTFTIYRKIAT